MSDVAVGGALIQMTMEGQRQVIPLISKKFSGAATRWSTLDKECFAIFYAVKHLNYLFGKAFVILTDHRNLLWMESSEVPKLIRLRIYLQQFPFKIRLVPGKDNILADWLSRMYNAEEDHTLKSSSSPSKKIE
jgi:hypothetical protein